MALDLADHFFASLPQLRFHPTAKRIRALAGDKVVVDSTEAMDRLGATPCRSVLCLPARRHPRLTRRVSSGGRRRSAPCGCGKARPSSIRPPGSPSTPRRGRRSISSTDGSTLPAAAFVPADPDFEGYAIVDFEAFDEWREEDELLVGHARDPFTTIDTRRSSRRVVVEIAGRPVADSTRTTMLFETYLPTRYYLPRDDVRMELLEPTSTSSVCAYKGLASYWTATIDDTVVPDVAWSYPHPHNYATAVKDLLSFFNERVDIIVDGQRVERPQTPWS